MDLKKRYDANESKLFVENIHFVLHCHHYNTLIHKAMVNTPFIDGKAFIYTTASKDFYETVGKILQNKGISGAKAILSACEELYRYFGYGTLDLTGLKEDGGKAIGKSSHLASGYLAKWGKQQEPVDDYGRGFIAASWALAFHKDYRKCVVNQSKCISCGDSQCEYQVEG